MQKLSSLEYLRLNKFRKFLYNLVMFLYAIPEFFLKVFKGIGMAIVNFLYKTKDDFLFVLNTFRKGSWSTKLSYVFMGLGNIAHGQIVRGLFFLLFEAVFILYMIVAGAHWLGMFITLGTVARRTVYNEVYDTYVEVAGDNSFKCLLYGLLTIFFIIAFVYTWRLSIKQAGICDEITAKGKKVRSFKNDVQSLLDDQFHKTLLALPLTGIMAFTIMPIIFMVLVSFTNFDAAHDGYSNLFTWVGLQNFNELLNVGTAGGGNLSVAFGEILGWTLMWAFLATFTNYFLGMLVAILINKKGLKLKKMWRGFLVLTIAIPQFISLLYVSKMFANNGLVNGILMDFGIISYEKRIEFWTNPHLARLMVVLINIWIGIPYLMLIATGVLMNIPQDLYESAKIDGANVWQQYTRITLPYMLFVTGPYLLTSFIGNINNFNVIFLLTGGGPTNPDLLTSGGSAGSTDLLITWLFNITTGATSNYKLAAVIAIMIFLVIATLSLIAFNIMPSTKNEDDYA